MNNRIKLDTTMLQSNSAMHLVAFMLTQRDLFVEVIDIMQSLELSNPDNPWNDILIDNELRKRIREVTEDFEYILKKHTTAIHRRSGTKLYKKDKCKECKQELDTWSTDGMQKRKDIIE